MQQKSSNQLRVFVPLFLLLIIDQIGITIVLPILAPLFYHAQNNIFGGFVDPFYRGIFYSITLALFPLFLFVGAPILGDISDQIGRKKAILICLFATIVSFLLSALAIRIHSVTLLMVSRGMAGFFCAAQFIGQAAINDISSPEKKALNLSLIMLAMTVGIILGPIIGGYASHWFSYQTPFEITAVLALLNIIFLLFGFKETYIRPEQIKINILKGFIMFFAAFKNSKIRYLSYIFIAYQFGWGFFVQFIPVFLLKQYHFSMFKLGTYFAYMGLFGSIALLLIFRMLSKIMSNHKIILIAFCITLLGMIMAVSLPYAWMQWVDLFFIACGVTMVYPIMISMFSNAVEKVSQGWIMGVTGSLLSVDWIIASLLVGPLAYIKLILPFFFIIAAFVLAVILTYQIRHPAA